MMSARNTSSRDREDGQGGEVCCPSTGRSGDRWLGIPCPCWAVLDLFIASARRLALTAWTPTAGADAGRLHAPDVGLTDCIRCARLRGLCLAFPAAAGHDPTPDMLGVWRHTQPASGSAEARLRSVTQVPSPFAPRSVAETGVRPGILPMTVAPAPRALAERFRIGVP